MDTKDHLSYCNIFANIEAKIDHKFFYVRCIHYRTSEHKDWKVIVTVVLGTAVVQKYLRLKGCHHQM